MKLKITGRRKLSTAARIKKQNVSFALSLSREDRVKNMCRCGRLRIYKFPLRFTQADWERIELRRSLCRRDFDTSGCLRWWPRARRSGRSANHSLSNKPVSSGWVFTETLSTVCCGNRVSTTCWDQFVWSSDRDWVIGSARIPTLTRAGLPWTA